MPNNIFVPSSIAMGFLGISYQLGSDFEPNGLRGTHHLMEHLMYNSFQPLWPKLTRLAVQHNAYTDTDRLGFYFDGLDDSLVQVAPELYRLITSGKCHWSEDRFEAEKATVLEEYRDVFNDQYGGTLANAFRRHYGYCDPIGLASEVENFTYQDSVEFCKRFAIPDLVCQVYRQYIAVPSGNEIHTIFETPKSKMRFAKFGEYDVPLEPVPKGEKTVVGLIGKIAVPRTERNQVGMVIKCLNDGLESPLVNVIQIENGYSYFSDMRLNQVYGEGVISCGSCTDNDERQGLRQVYTDFFSGNLSRHIPPDRFVDCMDGMRAIRRICNILSFSGVKTTVMEDSPFAGLDNFTYQEALQLLEKYFKLESFAEIEY